VPSWLTRVGITDHLQRAAILAEGCDPKDTLAGICPSRRQGGSFQKSAPALNERLRVFSGHCPRYVTSLCAAIRFRLLRRRQWSREQGSRCLSLYQSSESLPLSCHPVMDRLPSPPFESPAQQVQQDGQPEGQQHRVQDAFEAEAVSTPVEYSPVSAG
jgi:hypothetical protein